MTTQIIRADYSNNIHAQAIVHLLNSYAMDSMAGGKPLSEYTKTNLINKLSSLPNAISILAFQENVPVGLVNCFIQFSTFQCRSILHIQDLIILSTHRQQGIGYKILQATELLAKEHECCKINLEVLEGNIPAKNLYQKFGFVTFQLEPNKGNALYWEKIL